MKLEKAIYNYVDFELQHYEENKKKLEEARMDIIESSPAPANGQPTGQGITGDPTASKTIKLLSTTALIKLEQTVNAIDGVTRHFNKDYKQFFEMNYIKKMGIVKTCNEIPISERTFYNMRDKIVYAVAQELGLIE